MAMGAFSGVGLGPGDPELLTLKAVKALRNADIVFTVESLQGGRGVSARILDSLEDLQAERVELQFAMHLCLQKRLAFQRENTALIARKLLAGKNCAFACIGDPLTYGTCGYILRGLLKIIPGLKTEIIPGVNSWSALNALGGKVLCEDKENLRIIPGCQAYSADELEEILDSGDTLVFLKTYHSRNRILEQLEKRNVRILYGANIGLEGEFISNSPEEILKRQDEYLSMIIIKPDTAGKG
ncbi:MAG: precorrin-2 C(20)-methyltransferase [Victivallales bacterium]